MNRVVDAFDPTSYSELPLYNIQAAAAETGVPAITLRSWERRYGVPVPLRDTKGYRLYSERDIAVARWLQEQVRRGVGISQAVNVLRTIEQGQLSKSGNPGFESNRQRDRILDAALSLDEQGVYRLVVEALAVGSVETVAKEIIQPVLHQIGERWAEGTLSVTVEHFASNVLRSQVAQLVRVSPPPVRSGRIMVACAPGEWHDIGALILTLFLRRRGFDVIFVGASVDPSDFVAAVTGIRPDAVLISASRSDTALRLRSMVNEISGTYRGLLAVGGGAFERDPGLHDVFSGLHFAGGASEVTPMLERALMSRQMSSV